MRHDRWRTKVRRYEVKIKNVDLGFVVTCGFLFGFEGSSEIDDGQVRAAEQLIQREYVVGS